MKKVRILSIDGGGIRGIIGNTKKFNLKALEKYGTIRKVKQKEVMKRL